MPESADIALVRRRSDYTGPIFNFEAEGSGPELQEPIAKSGQPSCAPAFDFQDLGLGAFVLPAIGARIGQTDLIENAPDDGVDDVCDRCGRL